MCGIVGCITAHVLPLPELEDIARRMTAALVHRGPDDEGLWADEKEGILLGHRRLAILDLSPLGHQPMVSADGRYVIVYNGEVYNFRSLQHELEDLGHGFRGGSDTEVILAAMVQWGVEAAVQRFVGMFAFGLWDRTDRKLYLVRDRLGIKPLYYGWSSDGTFLFGSELKALRAWPGFDNPVDLEALALFFRHNYIPAPYTIYKHIQKLPQGNILVLKQPNMVDRNMDLASYWSAEDVWKQGACASWRGTDKDAADALVDVLGEAVRMRLVADVPVGAFLSGGIDSSAVVALMQAASTKPVRTFTIGFTESKYDEAPKAKAVAKYLGTDHTELYVTPSDAMELIPEIPILWDEPFADSSQIPTCLVSRMTRGYVTVALSGDGGDELFSGYTRYPETLRLWKIVNKVPRPIRKATARGLRMISPDILDIIGRPLRPILRRLGAPGPTGQVLYRMSELLSPNTFCEFYGWANSHQLPPSGLISEKDGISPSFTRHFGLDETLWSAMSLLDLITYLPDDILTKVDRASMAVGLEARVPVLDHRVVALAARLPSDLKVRNGERKWLLRQVLYRYVPRELIERPKMGFGAPIGQWLRGPLRGWVENLLAEDRLHREGYLIPKVVRCLWTEHLSGRCNHQYVLWNILMFQAWLEIWG
jgi:asparagine synthase (glutamine-hydrolysing)